MKWFLVAFLAFQARTCVAQASPNALPLVIRLQPHTSLVSSILMVPPSYEEYWRRAQRCAGVTGGELDTWHLYTVASQGFTVEGSDDVFDGFTFVKERKIYLRLDEWLDSTLVTHEMLHAVLYDNGMKSEHFTTADSAFIRCRLGVPKQRRGDK